MNELIQIAFCPTHVVYTFLLVLVVLYWLMIIIGAMDFGSFDMEVDVDADMEVDADVSAGAGLAGVMQFFNFGKLPFMVIMSFVILSCWAGSILGNYYLGNGSILFTIAWILPNLLIAFCLAKVITTPLIPTFENLDAGVEPIDYVGNLCTLVLTASNDKMGQAEVIIDSNRLLINVKTEDDKKGSLEKGIEAIILRKEKNESYYIIRKNEDL